MVQVSYADVFDLVHEHAVGEDIQPGDLVRTGLNSFPHFRVIAVCGDMAWVRNVDTGLDGLIAAGRCRRINGAPPG